MTATPPQIVFRTDASVQIGTGHVMRCLTLADALREGGAECTFICRPHTGHLQTLIAERGHAIRCLPLLAENVAEDAGIGGHAHWLGTGWQQDAVETQAILGALRPDWLIADHYALDRRWESTMRATCGRLMVMDDLADRRHDCDLLLDPSLGRTASDYAGLVPDTAKLLLGPQFALLRPEFARLRAQSLARRTQPALQHLLITMGGVDKDNVTGSVLDVLDACDLPADLRITVVMGPHAPALADVQAHAARMRYPTEVRVGVKDMAQLMAESDLAIGAAGGTSWERCCLGLPSIILILAENQVAIASGLQEARAALAMLTPSQVAQWLQRHIHGTITQALIELSSYAACITDGQGSTRVTHHIMDQYA